MIPSRATLVKVTIPLVFLVLVLTLGLPPITGKTRQLPRQIDKNNMPSPPAHLNADMFWARAKQEVYKSPGEILAQASDEQTRGLRYAKLIRGNPEQPLVALTFDDGPHPKFTPKLLEILRSYNVKATFFVVGEMALKHQNLVKAELGAGHEVGNHTYHHVNLTKIPVKEVAVEWQACQDVIKSISGKKMAYCRPPGGDYDKDVISAAMSVGLTTVLWTDDPGDYASPGATVIENRLLDHVENGGVILLHDGIQQTVDILPQVIERLKRNGFRFVKVSELDRTRKTSKTQIHTD